MLGIEHTINNRTVKEKKLQPSNYSPDEKVKELWSLINEDVKNGHAHHTQSWEEFNGRTLLEEINETKKAFNTWIPPRRTDARHSWRAQTRRPILRNKLINTIAHATKATLVPGIFAYDETSDEQDQAAATAMRSMINWVVQNTTYLDSFIEWVTEAVSQPLGILEVGYQTAYRKIRNNGKEETVFDQERSGYFFDVVPVEEFLFDNPYESNVQKQRWVSRVKNITYSEAKAHFGHLENFDAVVPGSQVVYNNDANLFYTMDKVPNLKGNLVQCIVYYNYSEDLEVIVLGGVIVGDPFAGNPYAHKKYPFAIMKYEPIPGFFWGKSQSNKILPDEQIINQMRNMFLDGQFLQIMPPFVLFGAEEAGEVVMVPGAMSSFEEEVKIQNVSPQSDLRGGLSTLQEIERSIIETSADPFRMGDPSNLPNRMPAYTMQKLEEGAEAQLGLLMGSMSRAVTMVSDLLVSNILQYATVPQLTSAVPEELAIKYPTFFVQNELEDNQEFTRKIVFNPDFFASNLSVKELSYKVLEMEGLDNQKDERLIVLNPEPFRNLKYKCFVSSETMQKRNTAIDKALKLEGYDRLANNPLIQQSREGFSNVTKDFLISAIAPGKGSRYLPEASSPMSNMSDEGMGGGEPTEDELPMGDVEAPTQNLVGQMTGSNSLAGLMSQEND